MPGAGRLLFHLHHAGVPVALATSTPRATMERKLAAPAAQGLRSIFQARRPGRGQARRRQGDDCPCASVWQLCIGQHRFFPFSNPL